jgi:hypothetical protein
MRGFASDEITPIEVDGETWRRLHVTFPDHIKTHSRQQIFCFGPDGLLRPGMTSPSTSSSPCPRSLTPAATATSTAS